MPNATPAPAGLPAQNGAGSPNSWGVITPASSAPNPGAASANAWGVILPTPKAPTISVKPIDTSTAFTKFAGINNFSVPTPTTSTQTSTPAVTQPQLQIKDNSIPGVVQNTLKGLPDAAKTVSDNLINKPITAAGNLLSNTGFVKSIANSANNNGVAANTTIGVLQKLSLGTQALSGVTGGALQPDNLDPNKDNLLDKGLSILANGVGFGAGIGAIGDVATTKLLAGSTYAGGSRAAVQGLTDLAQKFPLVGKYMAPLVQPLLSMAAGSAVESQLNPQLANDTKARAKAFGTAVATAPLYAAMGLLKNPAVGLGGSFLLGYGMTKLSGGNNTEAVTSGLAFSLLDGFGRAGGTRGEAEGQLNDAALSVLNHYAPEGVTLTANSTPDEIHAAFNNAVHQASPKVGGNAQELEAVKNAYDLLSKGGVSNTKGKTAPEVSVDTLHNETKAAIAKAGPLGATEAMKENLGVSHETAERIVKAAQTVQSPKESKDMIAADIQRQHPELFGEKGVPVTGVDAKQFGKLTPEQAEPLAKIAAHRYQQEVIEPMKKEGGPTIIGADDLKDHFGNDYNDNNHGVYSKAVGEHLLPRALKENTNPNFILTGGGPASGKTELITKDLIAKGFKGVLYDSNLSNYEGAVKIIDQARAADKHVEIHGVIPNIDMARTFSIQREIETGRGISDATFARGHAGFPNTIERLLAEGKIAPEDVHLTDTRNAKTINDVKEAITNPTKDPLALLRTLGYNETNFKEIYGKEKYDTTTGQRKDAISNVRTDSTTPTEDRSNKGAENGRAAGSDVEEKAQPFSGKRSSTDEQKPQEQNNAEGLLNNDIVYHGTKAAIKSIGDLRPLDYANPEALYGPGVYLTDNPKVAEGYAKTRGKGPEGKVFSAQLKSDLKFLDLDKPLSSGDIAIFKSIIDRSKGDLLEGDINLNGKTGAEAINILKEDLSDAHIDKYEAGEHFYDLQQKLSEEAGYNGFTHKGGINKDIQHNVKILFDYGDENKNAQSYIEKDIPYSQQKDELKSSKIGKSIEAKAIETGLTKGFPETAGYDATTFKEQAEKAAELFDSGIDNARAVIRGDEPLPEGLKGEAVIAAAEEYLIENPNAEMAEELANSPLVTANSESAQGLSLSRMRTPDSATAKLQQLKQKLIEAAGGKDKIAKARAKAKAAVNKVLLPKEDLQWNSFIDSITC